MRKSIKASLFLTAVLFLGGCEEKEEEPWIPDRTALQAEKDGTLKETLIDVLDKNYYSGSELESMVDSSIREYDADHGADAVTKLLYTAEGGQIRLELQYRSGQEMTGYNKEKTYNGSVLGAQMEGFLFDCNFRQVTDGITSEKIIGYEEPLSHKEYQVLICSPIYTVEVPGKIVYVSENAVTTAERIAAARTGTVEPANETESENLMYVMYEYQ